MHNNPALIHGVEVKAVRVYVDERGIVAEILRSDDPMFERFGQVYYATCNPGVVKAWHYHKIHTDYLYCIYGSTKVGLYDGREDSPTRGMANTFILGPYSHLVIKVPPGVLHGNMCLGDEPCILVNVPTHVYDPSDEYKLDPFDPSIPYHWPVKSR